MRVVQAGRQRIREIRSHQRVFGVAAILCVPRKNRVIAQIFHFVAAKPAIAIHAAHPGNTDARFQRQFRRRAFHHFSHDLVTGNEPRFQRRQIFFHDVQIGAANSTSDYLEQQVSGRRLWTRHVFDREKFGRGSRCTENTSLHAGDPPHFLRPPCSKA